MTFIECALYKDNLTNIEENIKYDVQKQNSEDQSKMVFNWISDEDLVKTSSNVKTDEVHERIERKDTFRSTRLVGNESER